MTRWLLPVLGLSLICLLAPGRSTAKLRAADNAGVVLYLALAPELAYDDTTSYRGLSATPLPEEALVTSAPSPEPQIAFILAAFPPEATPELQVVTFGIRYPSGIRVVRYGLTPRCLPMATRDWPLSSEGIAIGLLESPDTARVVEIGWLAIRADRPGRLELVPHPEPKMGARVVSTTPPGQVPIAQLGRLGFGEPGLAPTPQQPGPKWGATCVQDSVCLPLTRAEARYYQQLYGDQGAIIFLGEDVSCRGQAVCAEDAEEGACCLPDETCKLLTHKSCVLAEGTYQGDGVPCSPETCAEEPTPEGAEEEK